MDENFDWNIDKLFFFDKGRQIRTKRKKKTFDSLTESQQELSLAFAHRRRERSLSKQLDEGFLFDSNSTLSTSRKNSEVIAEVKLGSGLEVDFEEETKTPSTKKLYEDTETAKFLCSNEFLAIKQQGVKVRIKSDLVIGDEEDAQKGVDSCPSKESNKPSSRFLSSAQEIIAVTKKSSKFRLSLSPNNGDEENTRKSVDSICSKESYNKSENSRFLSSAQEILAVTKKSSKFRLNLSPDNDDEENTQNRSGSCHSRDLRKKSLVSRFMNSEEILAIAKKNSKVRFKTEVNNGDEEDKRKSLDPLHSNDSNKKIGSSRFLSSAQEILAITKKSSKARLKSDLDNGDEENKQKSVDSSRPARKQAEREIIQQHMYEKQLAKQRIHRESPLQLNGPFRPMEIPPRSPIDQDSSQSTTVSVSPPPRSPLAQDTPVVNDKRRKLPTLDFNEFYTPNGLNNKGFHGSNSILVMPVRKSTSDLYLPDDDSIAKTTKRRSSEDMIRNGSIAYADKVPRRFSAEVVQPSAKEENQMEEPPRNKHKIKQQPIDESLQRKIPKINRSVKGRVPKEIVKAGVRGETSSNEANGDDYDDVCDVREIYERKMKKKNGESNPIYHVVEKEGGNGYGHSFSNPEESSDADSHIYTNLEESIDEGYRREVENDASDEPYENIDFVHRLCNGNAASNNANYSDTSSVSYENVEFLNEVLNDQRDEDSAKVSSSRATDSELSTEEAKKIPPPIPRKVNRLNKQKENEETKEFRRELGKSRLL